MWLEIGLEFLLQRLIDGAGSKRASGWIRLICILLTSLLFCAVIAGLFLVTFLAEDQSMLRRAAFLLLGLGILAYYLQFLKDIMRKSGKRP